MICLNGKNLGPATQKHAAVWPRIMFVLPTLNFYNPVTYVEPAILDIAVDQPSAWSLEA
jgi:hypothetical protein